jgi:hypothetical protein
MSQTIQVKGRSMQRSPHNIIATVALWLVPIVASFWVATMAMANAEVPGRVGRVTLIQGAVSVFYDREGGWQNAEVNFPITSENSLYTDFDSRAEVRIGGTAIRLNELSQVDIQRLDYDFLHIHVVKGTVGITVRHFDRDDRYLVSTPEGRFFIRNNGRYRFDVDSERAESSFSVFRGAGLVDTDERRATPVEPGQRISLIADNSRPYFSSIRYAAFDNWTAERDDRYTPPARYVSTYITGYEELDQYGYWSNDPTYGNLWFPRQVPIGWTPFRHGRWQYIRPWGWTWIDAAPWGFAVSHYGRWTHVNGRWGWWPGRHGGRHYWAPAVVGFYGSGGNWSVGVQGPVVGWYPLAPWERYNPWFSSHPTYIRNVNNITIVNNNVTINNFNRQNGTTTMLRENFAASVPVNNHAIRVSGETAWQRQPVIENNFQAVLPPRNMHSKPSLAPAPASGIGGQVSAPAPVAPSFPSTVGGSPSQAPTVPSIVGGSPSQAPAQPPVLREAPGGRLLETPVAPAAPQPPRAVPGAITAGQEAPLESRIRAKPLSEEIGVAAPPRGIAGEGARRVDPAFDRAYRPPKDSVQRESMPRGERRSTGSYIDNEGRRVPIQAKPSAGERVEAPRAEGGRTGEASAPAPQYRAKPRVVKENDGASDVIREKPSVKP